jgi:DNA-binding NarL/FixJ family response regulator
MPIRILLADDHVMLRQGLRTLLARLLPFSTAKNGYEDSESLAFMVQ